MYELYLCCIFIFFLTTEPAKSRNQKDDKSGKKSNKSKFTKSKELIDTDSDSSEAENKSDRSATPKLNQRPKSRAAAKLSDKINDAEKSLKKTDSKPTSKQTKEGKGIIKNIRKIIHCEN